MESRKSSLEAETAEPGRRGHGVDWLLGTQRTDGSWGYRPGGAGYVEPTALAVLALLGEGDGRAEAIDGLRRALGWLVGAQHQDGSWGISTLDEGPSWMTAYAIWALAAARRMPGSTDASAFVERALGWLLAEAGPQVSSESERAELRRIGGIDGTLVGWSWIPGDSYWVFPTAISMIAAAQAGRRDHARVRQGVEMLRDRACVGGGWNIGNPYMLDKAFAPTAVDTAAAILALAAAGLGADPLAEAGRTRLRSLLAETTSPLGLAWGAIALRGHDGADLVRARLAPLQRTDGSWLGNPFATALAILAIADRPLVSSAEGWT